MSIILFGLALSSCCTNTFEIKSDGHVAIYAEEYEIIGTIDRPFIISISNIDQIAQANPKAPLDQQVLYATTCNAEFVNDYVQDSFKLFLDSSFYFKNAALINQNLLELEGVHLEVDYYKNVTIHFDSLFTQQCDSLQGERVLSFEAYADNGLKIKNEFTAGFNL